MLGAGDALCAHHHQAGHASVTGQIRRRGEQRLERSLQRWWQAAEAVCTLSCGEVIDSARYL